MVTCPGVYTFFSSVEVPSTGFCTTIIYFLITNQTILDKTVQYSNSSHNKKLYMGSILVLCWNADLIFVFSIQMSLGQGRWQM